MGGNVAAHIPGFSAFAADSRLPGFIPRCIIHPSTSSVRLAAILEDLFVATGFRFQGIPDFLDHQEKYGMALAILRCKCALWRLNGICKKCHEHAWLK